MAILRIVALAVAVAMSSGCAGQDVRGPFRTQFVDAETGKPIEGVVFLAVWHSVTPNFVSGGPEQFYDAREVVSGPDGHAEIPALTGPIWRIGVGVRFHEFASGGYVAERVEPTMTFMRRTTLEERCKRLPFASGMVPAEAVAKSPRYADAVSRKRSEIRCGA